MPGRETVSELFSFTKFQSWHLSSILEEFTMVLRSILKGILASSKLDGRRSPVLKQLSRPAYPSERPEERKRTFRLLVCQLKAEPSIFDRLQC